MNEEFEVEEVEVSVPGLMDKAGTSSVSAPDTAAEAAYAGIRTVLVGARTHVKAAVNVEMVQAYWEVGRLIVETQGERAEYGKRLLHYLAERLTTEFGAGFRESNLRNMRQFHTVCSQFATHCVAN